jgi:hypothetical protein
MLLWVSLVVFSLAATGCIGGSGGKQAAEEIAPRLFKVFNNTVRFAIETHVQPGALHDLGLTFSHEVDSGQSINRTLDSIAASDDPYGLALTKAMCIGLGQVASHQNDPNPQPATQQTWQDFLVSQVKVLLPNNPLFVIQTKVDQLNTTASLATVNPRLAAAYYQECRGS